MHQQLWVYKVEWKGVSRDTGGIKVEYHWSSEKYRHRIKDRDNFRNVVYENKPQKWITPQRNRASVHCNISTVD
jgi:hypothetical protein